MLVESQRGRIPGYSNWTLRSGNAEEESRWSPKLASTKECEESTKVPRTCQLL